MMDKFLLLPLLVLASSECEHLLIGLSANDSLVVHNGIVQGRFNNTANGFSLGPSINEIVFHITYPKNFEILEYDHDESNKPAKFQWISMNATKDNLENSIVVSQICAKRQGMHEIYMNLTVKFEDCGNYTIYWRKQCGTSKPLTNFFIGTSPENQNVVDNGNVKEEFRMKKGNENYLVPPEVNKTTFYIYLGNVSETLFIDEPYLFNAQNRSLYYTLSGSAMKNSIVHDKVLELSIQYACLSEFQDEIQLILVLDIPFVVVLNLQFFKSCPGKVHSVESSNRSYYYLSVILIALLLVAVYYYIDTNRVFELRVISGKIKNYCRKLFAEVTVQESAPTRLPDRELPDLFDDDSFSVENIKSRYGTFG